MIFAVVLFIVLLFLGFEELELRGVAIAVAMWAALLAGCIALELSPSWFLGAQVLIDIALVLIVFGGDLKIR